MTRKIFRSAFWMSTLILAVSLGLIISLLNDHFAAIERSQLESETQLAAQGMNLSGKDYLNSLSLTDYRLTWIARDGTVLYDNQADPAAMENHLQRQEVQQAMLNGTGSSSRDSATLSKRTYYYAVRLKDQTVLRMAVTQDTVGLLVLKMVQPILLILLAALAVCYASARRLSQRIVEPLNQMDLDHPLQNQAYDELTPMLRRIEDQNRKIDHQMEQLRSRREEFEVISSVMSEGLILIDQTGVILNMNPAARTLYQAEEDSIGKDLLNIDRGIVMQRLLEQVLAGKPAEVTETIGSSVYEIHASPVFSKGQQVGACLILFDAGEKVLAEQQRREFSANVSHELKSPLQTIMGAAELLENKMVKPADEPHFLHQISHEAKRLLSLIDDIIRLSEMDEQQPMARESVSLREVVSEAAEALQPQADRSHVQLVQPSGDAVVPGVHRLLYEIAYNLIDNAIRYNKDPGQVEVTIREDSDQAVLAVKDTGIGIAADQQQRIFERFYRVDKSRSRSSGGTGLGLSIVKHAVQYHHGRIEIHSQPGQGTEIQVFLPKTDAASSAV